jgi:hypothetical protein
MALTTRTRAQQLGHAYAEVARDEPAVEEVWVSTQNDSVQLWLITRPIDRIVERRLHGLAAVLHERYGRYEFDLHILNPNHFRGDVHESLPAQAEQIAVEIS